MLIARLIISRYDNRPKYTEIYREERVSIHVNIRRGCLMVLPQKASSRGAVATCETPRAVKQHFDIIAYCESVVSRRVNPDRYRTRVSRLRR